jgi:hypothetical protein
MTQPRIVIHNHYGNRRTIDQDYEYGLSFSTVGLDFDPEKDLRRAGIKFKLSSIGGGSADYMFPTAAERNRARNVLRGLVEDLSIFKV